MLFKNIKMSALVALFFHQLYQMSVPFTIDFNSYEDEVVKQYSDKCFKFITVWANVLLLAYCTLLLHYEWKTWNNTNNKQVTSLFLLKKFIDNFFVTIVFPTNMVASTYFWRLWNHERHILVPIQFDTILPPYMMHSLHTVPLIFTLFEFITTPRKKPRNHWPHIVLLGLYVSTYNCITASDLINGVFIYQFLKSFTLFDLIVVAMSLYCEHFFFYTIQWSIGSFIWNRTKKSCGGPDVGTAPIDGATLN